MTEDQTVCYPIYFENVLAFSEFGNFVVPYWFRTAGECLVEDREIVGTPL